MIKSLHIQNYRSIRDMSLELEALNIVFGPNGTGKSNIYKAIHLMHSAAQGQFSQALANEDGILKVFWAGKTRSDQLRRMNLAVETDTYEYELQVGFVEQLPYPSQFQLDPVIKEESIWLTGQRRRPSSQLMKRRNQAVFLNNVHHEKVTHSGTLYENESVFGQLGEPHLYPEVSQMRESLRNWRFYHEFSVSSGSAMRAPQVGFRSPVLASDGANLAAAFQTIVEIGDEMLLMRILDQALPRLRVLQRQHRRPLSHDDAARGAEQAARTGGVFRRHPALPVPGGSAVKPAPTGLYRVERTGKQPAPADAARAGKLNRRGQPLLADLAHQPLAGAGEVD